ncbi:MAG TPA: Hsp20/alpha crystallin family protein [bacterium]|nr:Hsp20/alpha crystallin family protein [bacterium]
MEISRLVELRARLEKALLEYLKGRSKPENDPEKVGCLDPSMDVYIDGERQLIFLETPDIIEDSINIELSGQILSFSAEKKLDRPYGRKYLQMERSVGTYFKSISLEDDGPVKSISHSYKYGVIKIEIEYGEKK